ncbi:outer membrane lipid asymmetry maintenance protein MlaD [Kordiimonas aestuarii]|uniref:outer membrane lipid asymmetry maintenance protein MlaD n=1 Tax=Kordiimonas aestuarii TaxID=1005925 RepID=UPI0021CF34C2|nr:outer membrane lipid asymmetry maintenance protein MlaD [Kordiimonas aestuarii]
MSSNLVESLIGALVLVIAGWFLVFAYERTDGAVSSGYTLQARFDRIDGLGVGADVRLSGIKVGSIVNSELDPKTYQAIVHFSVAEHVKLPLDTAAAITSEGLLGGTYLSLRPGGSLENLEPGDEISETQDAVDLIGLIGKFMYGDSDAKKPE